MACHLKLEEDSLKIVEILCSHRFEPSGALLIDVNAQDRGGNCALNHAALTQKLKVCKYLIEEKGADVTIRNMHNELAIDFPSSMEVQFYLSQHQVKTDPSELKRKKKPSKRGSFFRKYKEPSSEKFDEDEFFEAIYKQNGLEANGRKSI